MRSGVSTGDYLLALGRQGRADAYDDPRAEAEEKMRFLDDVFARGWQTDRDVAAVLALDGAVMRRLASVRDFACFVQLRNARPS